MSVNISAIKELRERTAAGMADCKNALVEAEGDMEKAVEIILKKGQAKSAKRAGATAAEGEVRAVVWTGGRSASIVEVNIQTDFAARNDEFVAFVGTTLAETEKAPSGCDLSQQVVGGKTLADTASEITGRLGEKIAVRRWNRLEIPDGKHGMCCAYVHFGGRIGVILAIEANSDAVAKHSATATFAEETAMQIAAMNPIALHSDEIDEAEVAKQREIFEAQLREDPKPKPEAVWPKIIDGRVQKWFSEVVLLNQESAQHKKPIDELRAAAGKEAGGEITITKFVRFELGEGIAKRDDDITKGVAELIG